MEYFLKFYQMLMDYMLVFIVFPYKLLQYIIGLYEI